MIHSINMMNREWFEPFGVNIKLSELISKGSCITIYRSAATWSVISEMQEKLPATAKPVLNSTDKSCIFKQINIID